MNIKQIFVSLLMLFTCIGFWAQETDTDYSSFPVWIEMMNQENVNMNEARKAFETYWKHNTRHQGDKVNKFERWYTINSNRLDKYGNVISAEQVKREFQRMRIEIMPEQKGKWYNYGPINVGPRNNGDKRDGGRVKHIAFHPTDEDTFFVSCFKGGLFKTSDGGRNWIPLTDQLIEQVYISAVSSADPDVLFIGTNLGLLKSDNGGSSWEATGLTSGVTKSLLIKPDENNVIIVGNASGIFRSENGGTSFSMVQSASKVEEIRVHPTNPQIMYAGTNGATSQFFRSIDGGTTWTENTTFGRGAFMKIAVTPAEPDYVYVINSRDHLDQDSFEGFYVSQDQGQTFYKRSSQTPCIIGYKDDGAISRGQPNYNLFVSVDPVNPDLIYAGGVKSWKSTNGGYSWTQIFNNVTTLGFGLHLDQLTWEHSPITNKLYAVNDGGVYFLNNDDKFQPITDGLPIAEVYECTQSQTNPSVVAGGTMHCGIKLNRDGVWYSPWGGDEATVLFDYSDDNYAYHFKYEKISRSSDGGFTFQRINPSSSDRGEYTGTGVLDKSDVNTLYVGLFEVERINNARTANSSQVWDKISSFGGSTKIQKIEQADANHDILYVSRGGGFYRSDNVKDTNPSFTNLTGTLPSSGSINDIATHPTNADIVYILLGSQIYKSGDKGLSWENMSDGLPAVALLEMVYDKTSEEGIYVGTDIGVYYKDATMQTWIDYSEGLPAIRVSGMDIYYGDSRSDSFITISTDGRGFWRSELNDIETIAPTVGFNASETSIFSEASVLFANTSQASPVGSFYWAFEGGIPATSIELNPEVKYNQPGTYQVSLTYITDSGTISKVVDDYITVSALPPPEAGFDVSSTTVYQGNIISFQDQSLNNPTSWEWTFEGGTPTSSTEQHPTVQYSSLGTFNVSLTVTNSSGTSTELKNEYINVTENMGSGNLQVHFPFQESIKDESSYSRDLVIVGSYEPGYVADKNGNSNSAYLAPGEVGKYLSNSYYGIGGNEKRTVTAWFKTSTTGSRKTLISWGRNIEGEMFNVMIHEGTVRVEAGSCSVRSTKSGLDDNLWHHLAITFDPNDGDKLKDVKIYIDGELDTNQPDSAASYRSEDVSINTDITTNSLRIGSVNYVDSYIWYGELDDVRIYSEVLNNEAIIEVMNSIDAAAPIADFNSNSTSIFYGEEVQFSDTSLNAPTSWHWTFEGGDPAESTVQHPLVTYPFNGTYNVTLKVTNTEGSDEKIIEDFIIVSSPPPPTASFEASNITIKEGETVYFSDTSTGNPGVWEWVFEGGTANDSSISNPEVFYPDQGTFSVSLTVWNDEGSNSIEKIDYISVSELFPPVADFTSDVVEIYEGEKVQFSDLSTENPTSWEWIFEGGNADDLNIANPSVTYATEGTYKVSLTVANAKGNHTKEVENYITVRKNLYDVIPNNNYTITATSETCINSNNGSITIEAIENFPYVVTISGNGYNNQSNLSINAPVNFSNLSAGEYSVCITVEGYDNYLQCFTAVVSEPEELSVLSKVNKTSKSVTLRLSGAKLYTIELNNEIYKTSRSEITIPIKGEYFNSLKVSTEAACQGIYEETIILNQAVLFYPNPTSDLLYISIPELMNRLTVTASVSTLNNQVILHQDFRINNGKLEIDFSSLASGIYLITVDLNNEKISHKIIKQ